MSFSTCFTSLCFIHPTCFPISVPISPAFSLILSLSSRYSSVSLSTSTRSGKVANVRTRIVGFTGRLSNSTRGFPFPASKRTTWRAASRFVLSYCRGLSRRCVLTTAARPMHGSERFRFPRVSGSPVCFAHPSPFSFARSLVQTRRIYRARCRRA